MMFSCSKRLCRITPLVDGQLLAGCCRSRPAALGRLLPLDQVRTVCLTLVPTAALFPIAKPLRRQATPARRMVSPKVRSASGSSHDCRTQPAMDASFTCPTAPAQPCQYSPPSTPCAFCTCPASAGCDSEVVLCGFHRDDRKHCPAAHNRSALPAFLPATLHGTNPGLSPPP